MQPNRFGKDEKINVLLKTLMVILFVTGAVIFFYPFASNGLNNYLDQQRIQYYMTQTEKKNQARLAAATKKMQKKNQKLQTGSQTVGLDSVKALGNEARANPGTVAQEYAKKHLIGAIFIPAITVSLPIFDTTNDRLLSQGATLLQGTSYPVGGKGTHAVLTGHTGFPQKKLFTDLTELKKGQRIFLEVSGKKLAYRIRKFKVVKPDQLESLKIVPGEDLLTLVTCTPYMINTDRLLVTAERIAYPKKAKETIQHTQQAQRNLFYGLVAVALLFCSLFAGWLGRRFWFLLLHRQNFTVQLELKAAGQPVSNQSAYLVSGWLAKPLRKAGTIVTATSDSRGILRFSEIPGKHYRVRFQASSAVWPKVRLIIQRGHHHQFTAQIRSKKNREGQVQWHSIRQLKNSPASVE